MNILILGSGGREHALARKIRQSKKADKIYIAPGNAGTSEIGTNIPVEVNDFEKIKEAVLHYNIEMVIVGPEDPLVNGICNFFKNDNELHKVLLIGPDKDAAQLEGSKDFAKKFMYRYQIPTAKYKSFTKVEINEAYDFLKELKPPYVLKADGLAAGKGVLILDDIEIAKKELIQMLDGKFGNASKTVVIEEFLSGIEVSVFVITDGLSYKLLPEAKDYKRVGAGDTGLNTGGMGAVSPVPFADKIFMAKVEEQIIKPTIKGIQSEKMDYKGFIFFGLIRVNNEPYVIEYNVRLGDPETEVIIPRIKTDLLEVLYNAAHSQLQLSDIEFIEQTATTVMLVSKGYPEDYEKGKPIEIGFLEKDVSVFHAGTKIIDNSIVTSGGRVIAVSATGKDIKDALSKSYSMINNINFEGKTFRPDIGFDL
jgi:phosphoribosylamine--glycine ligase